VTWSNDPSFNFAVLRRSTGDVLFNTSGSKLVFEDQFVEFVTSLPEDYNLAGLGERIHALRLANNNTFTIYNADAANPIDGNNYGSHPFYLDTRYYEANGTAVMNATAAESTTTYQSYSHGVYLRNAHGQEVVLTPTSLTWRTIGGAIDLYFFSGPTAAAVTQQYQAGAIGYPAMQQYWTFGYHQCRWGYANWTIMQDIVDNFKSFDIPLETIWSDIDYMKQYRDFENDPNTFDYEQAAEFLSKLHANGQHYVPIVDSAIYFPNPNNASDAYPPYDRGNDSDVYLMNPDGSQYIGTLFERARFHVDLLNTHSGAVWPGYTVFPDWHSTNAQSWWTDELSNWYTDIAFDGIWVDMSEVASFCSFSCGSGQVQNNPVQPYIGACKCVKH
jgi:alpha-glucosidase